MSEVFNVEEIFAKNVFTLGKMQERLTRNAYKEVVKVMNEGGELSMSTANIVAKAMKDWAVARHIIHTGSSRLRALLRKSMMLSYPIPMRWARC